jgi:hypothetical protein
MSRCQRFVITAAHTIHVLYPLFRNILMLAALCMLVPSWAARPFVTDDARLTNAGSCQVESWTRFYTESQEIWALPACNPTGNLEFTVGGGAATPKGQSSTTDQVYQLKTLFRPLTTNSWGVGLALGRINHPEINPGPNQLGNSYAYIPFSASFKDDKLIVHSNLGWLKDNASGEDRMTWGVGTEVMTNARLMLIAETFGDDKNTPYFQTGVRYTLIPNLLQVDATVGQQLGGQVASRWISFGLRWIPEKLFGK